MDSMDILPSVTSYLEVVDVEDLIELKVRIGIRAEFIDYKGEGTHSSALAELIDCQWLSCSLSNSNDPTRVASIFQSAQYQVLYASSTTTFHCFEELRANNCLQIIDNAILLHRPYSCLRSVHPCSANDRGWTFCRRGLQRP